MGTSIYSIYISLLMVAIGGAGCWALGGHHLVPNWYLYILPILVTLVGAICLFEDIRYHQDESHPRRMLTILEPFIEGWRMLWREKWILKLFGAIALINIVSGAADLAFKHAAFYPMPTWSGSMVEIFCYKIMNALPGAFVKSRMAMMKSGLGNTAIDGTLVVIIFLVIAHKHLSALAIEPEYAGRVKLVNAAFALVGVISAAGLVCLFIDWWSLLIHNSSGTYNMLTANIYSLCAYIIHTIVNAFMMAGLMGLLIRRHRGEEPSTPAFMRDSVSYFAPLAGVYLFIAALTYICLLGSHNHRLWPFIFEPIQFVLSGLMFFSIFSPIAVVVYNLGTLDALKRGTMDWIRHATQVLPFLAVASVIGILPWLLYTLPNLLWLWGSWGSLPMNIVNELVYMIIVAWGCLATWVFYTKKISPSEPEASVVEENPA